MKKRYWIYEWKDETSFYDPKGQWIPGSEYYSRTFKFKIPNRISPDDEDAIIAYIERHEMELDKWVE